MVAVARRRVVALAVGFLATACVGAGAPVVTTQTVGAGEVVETVAAPARVDAAARQDVAAALSGVVVALAVEDGAEVSAGDVIVRLDSSQVELAREQAEAARVAAAGVGGIAVDGGGAQTLASVNAAVADLDASAKPRIAEARAEAEGIEDPAQRAAARSAVDAVEVSYLATRAGLLATGEALARQQDSSARSLSAALNQAVRQATAAQRAQADAAAAVAAAQADQLVVTAPFDGVVQLGEAAATAGAPLPSDAPPELAGLAGALGGLPGASGAGTLRIGAPVVAGQTLFTVFDLSGKYVNVDVDEVDAPQVRIGQRAQVLVDAFGDLAFEGVVEAVRVEGSSTQTGGVGYRARVRLLEAAADDDALAAAIEGLRVGMTAGAEIITTTMDADVAVPSRALLRRDDATVVFVVRDGVARQVSVTVLAVGEELAAVDGDIEVGDEVVVTGYEGLTDGVAVDAG